MRATAIVCTALGAIGLVAAGAYLAYLDKSGWGWFLLAGFFLFGGVYELVKLENNRV